MRGATYSPPSPESIVIEHARGFRRGERRHFGYDARVRLIALVLSLPISASAQPLVQLWPAIGATNQVLVSGRVLQNAPSSGSSTVSKNLRRLSAGPWEGAQVDVRFLGRQVLVTSGHDGEFEVTFVAGETAFEPGLSTAEAFVKGAEPGRATVDVMSSEAPFFVVSDFDDTLAVTNVLSTRRFVKAVLAQDETTQPVVRGMSEFYACLRAGPKKPVFALVSGSPVQYAGRITRFLQRNNFPVFGMYLRNFGPTTLSNYKQPQIRQLLRVIPGPVVLVGDSGEKDPEVYDEIRTEFPQRVRAIFIRDVGRSNDPNRFRGMTLFQSPRHAAEAASERGLIDSRCIRTVPDDDGGVP
jgi:phosphatidate phosphatase APP1